MCSSMIRLWRIYPTLEPEDVTADGAGALGAESAVVLLARALTTMKSFLYRV